MSDTTDRGMTADIAHANDFAGEICARNDRAILGQHLRVSIDAPGRRT